MPIHWVPLKWLDDGTVGCPQTHPWQEPRMGMQHWDTRGQSTELRAAVEDRTREAGKAAALIRALEQEKAKGQKVGLLS